MAFSKVYFLDRQKAVTDQSGDYWRERPGSITFTKEKQMDFIRVLIAILLPPLGVFLQVGIGGAFWLNIVLTLLGYIPGIVHAIWVIAKR